MKPGIYRGLSSDEYHSGPGVSKSLLDLIRKSPAHLRAAIQNPSARKTTSAQAFGHAFHALLLEPETFAASYCPPFEAPPGALVTVEDIKQALQASGVPFRASARKADLTAIVRERLPSAVLYDDVKAEYLAKNVGRTELSADDWTRLHSMRDAVLAHKAASKLLAAPGESELSAYWREPVLRDIGGGKARDVLCRIRPDYWRRDGILIDLKSAREEGADAETFGRAINTYRYHVQHAMYMDGAAKALAAAGKRFKDFAPPRAFIFIAVEKDACVVDGVSKGVAVYQLSEQSVALGRALYREDIWRYAACEVAGRWPGYPEEIQAIDLPPYAFTQHVARAA